MFAILTNPSTGPSTTTGSRSVAPDAASGAQARCLANDRLASEAVDDLSEPALADELLTLLREQTRPGRPG